MSVQPGWLGVLIVVLIAVVCVIALTGLVYLVIPPTRRFIRKDAPVWWVRDIFIAVLVAILVLFGQYYFVSSRHSANARGDHNSSQAQSTDTQLVENLRFVRDKSSAAYQPRPFRHFDLKGADLAGLTLKGANFVQADLSGANLAGTDLSSEAAKPAAAGTPATPAAYTFLQGVNLCHAVLTGADLRNTYLVNANLTGVDLSSTLLQGAVLNGSDLTGATLPSDTGAKGPLASITYDDKTVWPQGFQPPPSGNRDVMGFLRNPTLNSLYGNIPRPECD